MTEIAFDDLEGLRASITEEWSDWGPEYEMTQEKVNQFAELTGDHQWIHVDVDPLVVTGQFGELVHLLLGHLVFGSPVTPLFCDGGA